MSTDTPPEYETERRPAATPVEATRRERPDDRLEIWYFIGALTVGGAERTLVDLVNGLDRERYDPTIWTLFDENRLADTVDPAVPIRTLGLGAQTRADDAAFVEGGSNPLDYVRAPLRFVRAVRREQPDIVQSFLFYDNTIARLVGLVAPKTTIVTGARGLQNISNPVIRAIDTALIPLSDRIISNSNAGADAYVARGANPERVGVVHNGRDLTTFTDAEPAGLRAELGLDADARLVGVVSRLVERKGQRDLIDAWPGIRRAHPDAHLVLVGDGVLRDEFADLAVDRGVSNSVHFLGTRDDVPNVLADLDLFAFPSHWEGLPGALLEAMAAGVPIVATDIPGNDELVTDGETGVLVPAHDPAALCGAISGVLAHPSQAERYGRAAQADAVDRFGLDRMVSEFEALYESLRDD
ncbi:glycosyltransferase (plasmid) [Haloferax larsenii]|uniref:Glycosyltransferase n=1 Tax=Haloferax larsenii TaxID=302484 RepID=A0ABY5RJA0_HALLR|nr:glycosyltransferase [Haloferax larsenii]UVE52439.1 glycosyltransferase [Haloferax larsenii]